MLPLTLKRTPSEEEAADEEFNAFVADIAVDAGNAYSHTRPFQHQSAKTKVYPQLRAFLILFLDFTAPQRPTVTELLRPMDGSAFRRPTTMDGR